jgi:hypothetical protein
MESTQNLVVEENPLASNHVSDNDESDKKADEPSTPPRRSRSRNQIPSATTVRVTPKRSSRSAVDYKLLNDTQQIITTFSPGRSKKRFASTPHFPADDDSQKSLLEPKIFSEFFYFFYFFYDASKRKRPVSEASDPKTPVMTARGRLRSAIATIRREQTLIDVYAREYNAEFCKPKQEIKRAKKLIIRYWVSFSLLICSLVFQILSNFFFCVDFFFFFFDDCCCKIPSRNLIV